ncbi:zf-TFIIB domain-containing protein [Orbus mooreae]|uniref:zf-TFIIB domain-containing protein n=1 Tax=Orbus mooreae TaxID=3074107 RepID=UPI00370D7159
MHCPKCKTVSLNYGYLEHNLPSKVCPSCQGHWLLLDDYLNWKNALINDSSLMTDLESKINVEEIIDTKHALICPISGILMTKFRITKQTEHRLDVSSATGGIWIDKGEWELLKKFNLAQQLNHIFTTSWQNKIRTEMTREVLAKLYIDRFGEEDYYKLAEIKQWIDQHPQKEYIKSFLFSHDPWSTVK